MAPQYLFACILLMGLAAYFFGTRAIISKGKQEAKTLYSVPGFYGLYLSSLTLLPAIIVFCLFNLADDYLISYKASSLISPEMMSESGASAVEIVKRSVSEGANLEEKLKSVAGEYFRLKEIASWATIICVMFAAWGGFFIGSKRLKPEFPARIHFEKIAIWVLHSASFVSIIFTLSIVFSIMFESIKFFKVVSPTDFLFGYNWSPQMVFSGDQEGVGEAFGAVPLFLGTILITLVAMFIAVPLGLFSAIYMSEYSSRKFRSYAKPMLELLAGIPTVVYGYFAIVFLAPALKAIGDSFGISIASESALVAGVVMGVMIIPFVSSLSDDVINSIPQALRDGSLALGATTSETVKKVILPAALPGVMGAVLLAISRAIGETMIVVMSAGLAANLSINPLESVTTVTVQIVKLLVGDQEFDSPKTLAAFALGLTLFIITLAMNYGAISIVKRYREKYD